MARKQITQDLLQECFLYSPSTGEFKRRKRAGSRGPAGAVMRYVDSWGYVRFQLRGVPVKAHRMAFLYMLGEIPSEVDHINGVRHDNRWINLRPANRTVNARNSARRSDSTVELVGVLKRKDCASWSVMLSTDKGRITKCVSDFFEAACLRKSWEAAHGYHPNHGRAA